MSDDARHPAELDAAWKLFEQVRERDAPAVADKASILATFAECLATVRNPSAGQPAKRPGQFDMDLDDDVPF